MEPEMNHRSSAMTARTKTRLVVNSGSISVGGEQGSLEGREREKRRGGGAKMDRVPVPVLEDDKPEELCPADQVLSLACRDDARRYARCPESNQDIDFLRVETASR